MKRIQKCQVIIRYIFVVKHYFALSFFKELCDLKKESGTKVVLKPVCNVVYAIFGRSKAQDRNGVNGITLRIQTFETRLCYKNYKR